MSQNARQNPDLPPVFEAIPKRYFEKPNANDLFEARAAEFHKATGMLAPGKDDRLGAYSREERVIAWDNWIKARALLEARP